MFSCSEVRKNTYYDSVTLMLISGKLEQVQGVKEAAAMMGTEHNKQLMIRVGILDEQSACGANDLIIGVLGETQEAVNEAQTLLQRFFEEKNTKAENCDAMLPAKSIEEAVERLDKPNICVISLPGKYAKRQAMKALRNQMHVLLFSDNMTVQEEKELKAYAQEQGLLLMGPDCGTAIIAGAALGFANVVRRGHVGIVAAAGTGLQEAMVLVERYGAGISHAIGTGGRDVTAEIGGCTMQMALQALNADEDTHIIGIISKPPAPVVLERIKALVRDFSKPVVACILGARADWAAGTNILAVETIDEAALRMAALDGGSLQRKTTPMVQTLVPDGRRYIRGLFSGGTLCYEAMQILSKQLAPIYSNISSKAPLEDVERSIGHTLVDMGDDYFTDGMPHPMIDMRLRIERIKKEAADAETAVILLDCVLGYGCHENPAEVLADAIRLAQRQSPGAVYVASVCGTDKDMQNRSAQVEALRQAGVIVAESNARAAEIAAQLIKKR